MAGTSRCGTWTARSATAAPSAAANRSARRSRCTEAGRTASRPRLVYHFRSLSTGWTSMPDQASSIALDTRAHALRAAARVAAIEPFHVMEVVKAAAELAGNGVDVISMSVGEPDFTATEGVAEAAIAAIRAGATQYTDALGLGPLRSAIAAHYQRAYGIEIDARRVVVTAGASAGLLLACAAMVAAVHARGGVSIVDEIYQGLSFDGAPETALRFDADVITVNSFSKYFNMTGWRLGWLVVPDSLVPVFEKLAQNLFICPSTIAQYAALACFEPASIAVYEQRRLEFKRRCDYLVPALRALGFSIPVMPDGAFYVYADISGLDHPDSGDSAAFCMTVLRETGLAIVPGADFGVAAPERHVRFSYATSLARIEQAVARLAALLGHA